MSDTKLTRVHIVDLGHTGATMTHEFCLCCLPGCCGVMYWSAETFHPGVGSLNS